MITDVQSLLGTFLPFGLEETEKIRLMDRVDTKFVFPASRVSDLFEAMDGKYRILEVNGQRICKYSTTYLDTSDYLFFTQHVTGKSERYKVRFRYYASTGGNFLEVKKKTKNNRTVKWRVEDRSGSYACNNDALQFIGSHVPDCPENLNAVLTNSFRRVTFVCPEHPERITLDLDLAFSGQSGETAVIPWIAIAELKSEGLPMRSPFRMLMKKLSVNPTGFSKYCMGNALLFDVPHKFNLKPKLLLINKLKNEYNQYACS